MGVNNIRQITGKNLPPKKSLVVFIVTNANKMSCLVTGYQPFRLTVKRTELIIFRRVFHTFTFDAATAYEHKYLA